MMPYPVKALLVPADSDAPLETITLESWRDIQTHVDGTFDVVQAMLSEPVELVDQLLDVWVNDEGLIWNLPLNRRASWVTLRNLVGNAVITGPPDAQGETTDCPSWVLMVMKHGTYRKDLA